MGAKWLNCGFLPINIVITYQLICFAIVFNLFSLHSILWIFWQKCEVFLGIYQYSKYKCDQIFIKSPQNFTGKNIRDEKLIDKFSLLQNKSIKLLITKICPINWKIKIKTHIVDFFLISQLLNCSSFEKT